MRYAVIAFAGALLCGAGLFAWMSVDIAARAFGAHPDSQPNVYLFAGGVYAALALTLLMCVYAVSTVRVKQ